jgi:hypothetical protein
MNIIGEDNVINIAFSYEHSNVKGEVNIVLEAKKVQHLLNVLAQI